jgi:hypothetical protein
MRARGAPLRVAGLGVLRTEPGGSALVGLDAFALPACGLQRSARQVLCALMPAAGSAAF